MNARQAALLPRRLSRFADPGPAAEAETRFRTLASAMLATCLAVGTVLSLVDVAADAPRPSAARHRVTVETAPVAVPRPPQPAPAPAAAPRLDPSTILARDADRPVPREPVAVPEPAAAPAAEPPAAPARRVYGVRKVYARGLGTGTAADPGLVARAGNTVDGRPDTLTATAADLRGELAALSTVDQAPEPESRVKPVYSPALIGARAAGTVSAYLLVDIDGSVRGIEFTADIGHDSREVAAAAFSRFRFHPALKDGRPVAVWILHHIRFEFQE